MKEAITALMGGQLNYFKVAKENQMSISTRKDKKRNQTAGRRNSE